MSLPSEVVDWIASSLGVEVRPAAWESLGNAGGFSGARLWRGSGPAGLWCLRCWPLGHPDAERLGRIHGWLDRVSEFEIVAAPCRGVRGETFLETRLGRWEVSRWLPGVADFASSPSDARLCEAAVGLARLHRCWSVESTERPSLDAITRRCERLMGLQGGEAARLSDLVGRGVASEFRDLSEEVLFRLAEHGMEFVTRLKGFERGRWRVQPCLRDVWHDHLLFESDCLTGVVDYGAMAVDTPLSDLSRMLGSLVGDDDGKWSVARAAYESEFRLGTEDWDLARVLDRSGCLLGACNWLTWIWLEGREFDDGARVLMRIRQLVERMRHWTPPAIALT